MKWFLAVLGALLVLTACEVRPDASFTSELAGDNEVPAVATTASGSVTATLTGNRLELSGSFTGLESDLREIAGSAAHIHRAPAGENGPIVLNLTVAADADRRGGTLSLDTTLTPEQRADFLAGEYYVNIHTDGNPAGELRAQLVQGAPTFAAVTTTFDARLLGDNEVHEVETEASGRARAVLRGDTLVLSGHFAGLSDDLREVAGSPAHVHEAAVGENGGIAFNVTVAPAADNRSGRFGVSRTLSESELAALMAGDYYLNVHTEAFPPGELRGQLFESSLLEASVDTELSGANEVPPVETVATGSATATLAGFTLSLSGSFSDLESDLRAVRDTPAHIHRAPAGENGGIVFLIDVDADEDNRGGTLSLETLLNDEQIADFLAGLYYVNIHTEENPGGELRGQLAD